MKEEIIFTANVWADQIKSGRYDNGDAMHSALGSIIRGYATKPTEEQLQNFRDKLIELLTLNDHNFLCLSVDYHPCPELREACEYSGISVDLLPVKSVTWTSTGKVQTKFGYGGDIKDHIISSSPATPNETAAPSPPQGTAS